MDRKFVLTAFGYAILGMVLGIWMAATKDHGQFVTHAHIMLIGFLLSLAYGLCHRLWLQRDGSGLSGAQYWLHQAGTLIVVVALFLLYGERVPGATVGPVLGVGSVTVLLALVLMKVMVIRDTRTA